MASAADRFALVEPDETDNLCFLCLKPSEDKCNKCGISVCSAFHLEVHYNQERDYCYPFRVLQKPGVGRYLVATRDLEPLELIIEDDPGIFGPNHDTPPSCLECLLPVDGDYLCSQCSLPLCGPDCASGPNHVSECQVFSQPLPTNFSFRVEMNRQMPEGIKKRCCPEYCCIAPLRALQLKKNNPKMWQRILLLMDHEERQTEEAYQKMFQVNVIDFLIKTCGLDYSESEIQQVIGIIRTNALQVQDPIMKVHGVSGRVVYPTLSYLSHSCICNARYSMSPKDHSIKVRSQTFIGKGQEITIQYLSFMYGHLKRKFIIKDFWFFDCACSRCQDPSELGSYMSAMKCTDCNNGNLLTMDPMDSEAQWLCSNCGHKQSAESIKDYINYCENQLEHFEINVEKYENLLEEFSSRLHPNHYIMITIKKFLADLYKFDDLKNITKKIDYYQEFLDVIGKVDPGFPSWRGSVLYEMHRPMLIKANKSYESGSISKDEFLASLKNISQILEESVKCLQVEADGTKEALQASMASKALTGIKEILFFSEFI